MADVYHPNGYSAAPGGPAAARVDADEAARDLYNGRLVRDMKSILMKLSKSQIIKIMCDNNADPHRHYSVELSLEAISQESEMVAAACSLGPILATKMFERAAHEVQDEIIRSAGIPGMFIKKFNVHIRYFFAPVMIPPQTSNSQHTMKQTAKRGPPLASTQSGDENSNPNSNNLQIKKEATSSAVLASKIKSLPHGIAPHKSLTASIHDIPRANEVGQWRIFRGTIVRTSDRQVLQFAKDFQCSSCLGVWRVESTREGFNSIERPTKCCAPSRRPDCQRAQILDLDVYNSLQNDTTTNGNENTNRARFAQGSASSSTFPSFALDSDGRMTFSTPSVDPQNDQSSFRAVVKDYQEIKVQEAVDRVSVGKVPKTIAVVLEDDMVESVKPGEEVLVCGTVVQRFRQLKPNEKVEGQLIILATHIRSLNQDKSRSLEITEEVRDGFVQYWDYWKRVRNDPIRGRDQILKAFAPTIYGMCFVKLGILLSLVGGVEQIQERTRTRGDIHLLIVGDPGTGKSQFLKAACQTAARSVFTTGVGSTSAGLTCAAVKEGGEWHLDAGALVLADRGLCCIDEFSTIGQSERATIHEAMEQQTVSVAKAGIVTSLPTRCAVLAAANPKGNYDPVSGLSLNLGIASPLLSRFDIIMVLLDRQNDDWDRAVSDFILSKEWQPTEEEHIRTINTHKRANNDEVLHSMNQRPAAGSDDLRTFSQLQELGNGDLNDDQLSSSQNDCPKEYSASIWTSERLRSYISYCKEEKIPTLTPDASRILQSYYQRQRQSDARNAGRTTIRLLESLIRLSQAHAKLMLQDYVTVDDAVVVVRLVDAGFQSTALVDQTVVSLLHSGFPRNPKLDHKNWYDKIVSALHPELYERLRQDQAKQGRESSKSRSSKTNLPDISIDSAANSSFDDMEEEGNDHNNKSKAKRPRDAPVSSSQGSSDTQASMGTLNKSNSIRNSLTKFAYTPEE